MSDIKFESWGIVEIMGHVRLAGKISEQVIAGAALLRVDVPKTPSHEPFTKFYGAAAIYSILPTDEVTATTAAIAFEVVPIQEYILRLNSPALADKIDDDDDHVGQWMHIGVDDDDDEPGYLDDDDDIYDDEDEEEAHAEVIRDVWKLVRVERDETKNSKSPMFRFLSDDGERVNVFKHSDPSKDTFSLFAKAGYGEVLETMKQGEVLTWHQHPISVVTRLNGGWYEVVSVSDKPIDAAPDAPAEDPKLTAVKWAIGLVALGNFVVLDTETTGLSKAVDEPVSIAVIDSGGAVLLDTLVKSERVAIDAEAQAVHGITMDMLKDAPKFADIRDKLREITAGKHVVVYNAEFDFAMIGNANGSTWVSDALDWTCAMTNYAAFHGERWQYGGFKPVSLQNACNFEGIELTGAHTALGDCKATLELIKKLAAYEPEAHPF